MRITALKQALAAVLANMDGLLQAAADDGGRDLAADELAQFEAFKTEADGLEASIKREEELLRLKSSSALPVTALTPSGGQPSPKAEPRVAEKMEPGIAFARITTSLAAAGMDQRAAAAHAESIWGSEMGQIVANMEQSTDVKGGFLVEKTYSRDFIELLRPRVVIRQLGARSVPMASGNLTMRKKTGSTQAAYVGERAPIPATNPTFGEVSMAAKKLAAIVPITNELLRHSGIGVDSLVRDDLLESVAVKEDQQFIRGAGSATSPKGLIALMLAGNKIDAQAGQALATVSDDLRRVRLKVLNANVPMSNCGWIMSPRVKTFLEELRDGNGNIVYPSVANGVLHGYPIGMTTSVPDNLGVGTNESEIYFGDFAQFLIGDTYNVTLAASTEASYVEDGVTRSAFQNDETLIRVIEEHDTGLRHDAAFAMLQKVTWGA
ncbi:MAG: phage major capsid protein [Brevundimonas sp.]|uniref:phage major capsid protein n=1 Tax=Brevundimonas sp. TaxID=1871086 RepID=UPI004034DE26